MSRTITISQAEFLAIAAAAALHQAEYDGQGGTEERDAKRVDAHLSSVLDKWRKADPKGGF